jgi:endonuclease-3 related protein
LVSQAVNHPWPDNYKDAVKVQEKVRRLLVKTNAVKSVRLVAGADVSYSKTTDAYFAAVVVMSYPEMEVVEEAAARGGSAFPYIPGLLTFREGPVTLAAFRKLKSRPDLIIFDGHGVAHPRGFGIASHMGVLLGIPSVGCAKTVLVGEYKEPGQRRGSSSPLVYNGAEVGRALRTRDGVAPVYVSIGHMVDLDKACAVVLGCAKRYRLPEPTRKAHILGNRLRKEYEAAATGHAPAPGPAIPPLSKGGGGGIPARDLIEIYNALYAHYGPQNWWPGDSAFEMMVGAVLTQNTNWGNVEKAIANLKRAGALSAAALHIMPEDRLAELIRPSGYFNIKAKRLKAFIEYFMDSYGGSVARMKKAGCDALREEFLSVKGIGPETADSILLYALGCPTFVVDAYTKRIFSRHGFFPETADYNEVRKFFMDRLPVDVKLYNEYHALVVRLGKDRCMKKAGRCDLCLLTEKILLNKERRYKGNGRKGRVCRGNGG